MPEYEIEINGRAYDVELPRTPFDPIVGNIGNYALRFTGHENGQVEMEWEYVDPESNAFSELGEMLDPSRIPLIGRFF